MLNIFLAEDNPGDILLVQLALQEHHIDHTLHVARDGEEALSFMSRLQQNEIPCPDIFLLDLNLPKADGPQLVAAFRRESQCGRTPVIVVSSSDAPADRERMAALGIARYFRKSSDLDSYMRLGAIVREVAGLV